MAKKAKKKSSGLLTILLAVVIFAILLGGNKNKDQATAPAATQTAVKTERVTEPPTEAPTDAPTDAPTEVPAKQETKEPSIVIAINTDEAGEYGKEMTLNANTDMPIKFYGYFLPAGTYNVSIFIGSTAQISVYKAEKEIVNGWEEFPTGGSLPVVLLSAKDKKTITVSDGEFVKISGSGVFTFVGVE